MKLTNFLMGLIEGETFVANELHPFDETDNESAIEFLSKFYDRDRIEMPGVAPGFDASAALWGAQYIYRAFQLLLLRKLGPEHIEPQLTDYLKPQTAEAIYSADLALRHLPMVFSLAKSFAPDDPLVMRLRHTAQQWPFSSVGCTLDTETPDISIILSHPSLRTMYADRIIDAKDKTRVRSAAEKNLLLSVLGNYGELLWPGLEISPVLEMNNLTI